LKQEEEKWTDFPPAEREEKEGRRVNLRPWEGGGWGVGRERGWGSSAAKNSPPSDDERRRGGLISFKSEKKKKTLMKKMERRERRGGESHVFPSFARQGKERDPTISAKEETGKEGGEND